MTFNDALVVEKKLISQRWDESFHQSVKSISEQLNMSITDMTIEGLKILIQLSNNRELFLLSSETRIKKIVGSVLVDQDSISTEGRSTKTRDAEPGFITNRITKYLRQNKGTMIATTQISSDLNIPQSTVRRYVQDLSNHSEYKIIPGRPNFIGYMGD